MPGMQVHTPIYHAHLADRVKEVRSSYTAVNSAFIGVLFVLSRFPVRSPPPRSSLWVLVMMFGLTDAACDTHGKLGVGCGVFCKCKSEWFSGRHGTGSCQAKRADGQRAHHSGVGSTPDYNSCQAGLETEGARPLLYPITHRTVRLPHHPHFTLSCPDVAPAD